MAATDQQRLDALRDSYLRIVNGDAREMREGIRSLGFHSLKDMGDEIDRLERKIAMSGGRRILQPVTRVNI